MTEVLRLAAFSDDPAGGNPAGVVLDASTLADADMQRIAARIGDAETAFVVRPPRAPGAVGSVTGVPLQVGIRYFSPVAEVPFCGHATIATAVALADRMREEFPAADDGTSTGPTFVFETPVGPVRIVTARDAVGRTTAAFTSIEPVVSPIDPGVLDRLLAVLVLPADPARPSRPRGGGATPHRTDGALPDRATRGPAIRPGGTVPEPTPLTTADLDPAYPARLSAAGNTHPVVVLADRSVFDRFVFDPGAMRHLMDEQGWAGTVTVLHASGPAPASVFEARNPFPVGTLDEDPATGSAAASVGGWLRATGLLTPPVRVTIHQGRHVGRPGVLLVDVPTHGGIVVTGTAVEIPGPVVPGPVAGPE